MTIKFGRVWDFQLGEAARGGIRVRSLDGFGRSLRVQFQVTRNESKNPNQAELDIYGLGPKELNALSGLTSIPCSVSVGHIQTGLQQVFLGELRRCYVRRQEKEIALHADMGDSTTALRTAKVNKAYPKGTNLATIVDDVVKTFEVQGFQDLTADIIDGVLPRGVVLRGDSGDVLTDLLRPFDCLWYCDSGKLIIAPRQTEGQNSKIKFSRLFEPAAVMLKKDVATGELRKVVNFKVLMEPLIFPGAQFEIADETSDYQGRARCSSIIHRGDTHDRDWSSEVEGSVI